MMAAILPPTMAHKPTYSHSGLFSPRPPKRRAPSPALRTPLAAPSSPHDQRDPPSAEPIESLETPTAKRRRPNLANGFSSLSLGGHQPREAEVLPSYDESLATRHQVDDEDDDSPLSIEDIRVQQIPDREELAPHWSIPSHASSSSASSSTDDDAADESDTTFINKKRGRPAQVYRNPQKSQQPSCVEYPSDTHEPDSALDVEEVATEWSSHGSRRARHGPDQVGVKKRRRSSTDHDIEMDEEPYGETRHGTRRRTEWHEPEKDRIVITSLGSSPSTSRSTSPDRSSVSEDRQLFSQPGDRGFTLNPSLLTHLLQSQRTNLSMAPDLPQERGLVLYRPLGIHAGGHPDLRSIVQTWQDQSASSADASRFEELGEDEGVWAGGVVGENEAVGLESAGDGMDVEMA